MEKVKVSKKLFKALENVKENSGFEDLLKSVSTDYFFVSDLYKVFNDISILELAEIIIKGYEVEKTKEEKALEVYNALPSDDHYDCGRRNGIKEILDVLDIKIKGIND